MTAAQLLDEMGSRGVSVSADGDRLLLRPRSALTPGLVSELRSRKAELLTLLRSSPSVIGLDTKSIAAMPLDAFTTVGLIVQVHVSAWGRDVLFVSDDVPESEVTSYPQVIFRAHDLKKLARIPLDPQHLRNIQMVTEIFGGTIENVRTVMEAQNGQPQEVLKNGTAG